MPKLSLRSRYSLILLAVSIAILALGIVFKPRKQAQGQQLSESELFRLQNITQQQRLDDLSEFLGDTAERLATRLLYLKARPCTAVARGDNAVSSGAELQEADRVQAVNSRGDAFEIERLPAAPGAILQVFNVPKKDRPASPSPAGAPAVSAGDWVLAVARNNERQPIYAQGVYHGVLPARCGDFAYREVYSSTPLSAALAGGGLFTTDGDLLGVIADCGGRPVVVDIQDVDEILHRDVPVKERLLDVYGMGVAEAAAGGGVLITSVWSGGRADQAGILPADIIAAADDQPVATVADLARLTSDGAKANHSLALFRGRKQVRVTLRPSLPPSKAGIEAAGGLMLDGADNVPGVRVERVIPGSAAALSGVRAGDLVTAIEGRPVEIPQDGAKLLSRSIRTQVTLTIMRNGSMARVVLMPSEAGR